MGIPEKIRQLKSSIPEYVTLVAVSKTHPEEVVMEAFHSGQHVFGENKVQELTRKAQQLPDSISWHMIGHLQTNKIKQLLPVVDLIHSIDRINLLQEINKEAVKINKIIPCLLQVHIAKEDTKFGFSASELLELFDTGFLQSMKNIKLQGLMGMATYTDDAAQIKNEFHHLRKLFDTVQTSYSIDFPAFKDISMGMSNDYHIAIDEGSTMIRVGSFIFGERTYK